MLYAASLHIREQELVSLGTTGTLATTVTPELGLVQQGIWMIPLAVVNDTNSAKIKNLES